MYYSIPLNGVQFKSKVRDISILYAQIQIYCRIFDLTDEESLALLIAGGEVESKKYFESHEYTIKIAKKGIERINHTGCIDLTFVK